MSNSFIGGLSVYEYEVAKSRISGAEVWNKFGYNDDIDTASEEVIASWGGTFDYLETADTLEVVSTSVNDDSAGTGARSVLIYGVDENNLHIQELVTMDGTTAVTTSNSFLGVNRVVIYQSDRDWETTPL